MNWKIRFRKLTGWRPKNERRMVKNDEERWRISTKSLTETSRKRYGSASTWILFFTKTNFLTNFKRFLNTRRAEPIYFALLPLFIGEKREVIAAQLAQASWVASTRRHRLLLEPSGRPTWAWLLFAPPIFTNTPPFVFFYWFISEMLRNFTDYSTIPIFLPKHLRNFMDYATMLVLTSRMLRNFMDYATVLVSRVPKGANKVRESTRSTPGRN